MKASELTVPCGNATHPAMIEQAGQGMMQRSGAGRVVCAVTVLALLGLGGCINVSAPDKPIVIELNINIRQEVIYRLAEDAANTIEENADIF